MDTIRLQSAVGALLDAAATVADSAKPNPAPPSGEWSADQILAHVALLNAATLAAVSAVSAGTHATYDNRIAQDTWTIGRVITLAGGDAGLRDRITLQADALRLLTGALSDAELDILVPTRLLSKGTVMVDQPMPLRDLLVGLADAELPGHTRQLLALLPSGAAADGAA